MSFIDKFTFFHLFPPALLNYKYILLQFKEIVTIHLIENILLKNIYKMASRSSYSFE